MTVLPDMDCPYASFYRGVFVSVPCFMFVFASSFFQFFPQSLPDVSGHTSTTKNEQKGDNGVRPVVVEDKKRPQERHHDGFTGLDNRR